MKVVHPLPAEGVDLRAELAAHQHSRVEQALARAPNDLALAAKLLRVSPLELTRLHAGMTAPKPTAEPTKPVTGTRVNTSRQTSAGPVADDEIPRIERGVELISTAAIRRLRAEGRSPKDIAKRLGCNPFVVDKVLRMDIERTVRRLDSEGVKQSDIAQRLCLTVAYVNRVLSLPLPELAKCGAKRGAQPSPPAPPPPAPPPRDHWRGV